MMRWFLVVLAVAWSALAFAHGEGTQEAPLPNAPSGGGGSPVSVDGSTVVNPNFDDGGDIDCNAAGSTITCDVRGERIELNELFDVLDLGISPTGASLVSLGNGTWAAGSAPVLTTADVAFSSASGEVDGEDCNGEVSISQQLEVCIDSDGAAPGDSGRPVLFVPGGANGTTTWKRVALSDEAISDHSLIPAGLNGDTGHDDKLTLVDGATDVENVECPAWADDGGYTYLYRETHKNRTWLCTLVGVGGVAEWRALERVEIPFPSVNEAYSGGSAATEACASLTSGFYASVSTTSNCHSPRLGWRVPEDGVLVGVTALVRGGTLFDSSGSNEDVRACDFSLKDGATVISASTVSIGDTSQGADLGKSATGTTPTSFTFSRYFEHDVDAGDLVYAALYQPASDVCTDAASCECWDASNGTGNLRASLTAYFLPEIR